MVRYIVIIAGTACLSITAGLGLALSHNALSGSDGDSSARLSSLTRLQAPVPELRAEPALQTPRVESQTSPAFDASADLARVASFDTPARLLPNSSPTQTDAALPALGLSTPDPAPAVTPASADASHEVTRTLDVRPLKRPVSTTAEDSYVARPLPQTYERTASAAPAPLYQSEPQPEQQLVSLPPQLSRRSSTSPSPSFFIGVFR
ncbi:hypothetical protein [Tritonibacter sp. AK171]|uniref:hypothetical protein n=1 Tax=Tritonibacter sp. AK171 TaxID=3048493 RepID=UPI0024C31D7C|nr:hypothetical protein [Tritonibacter sp. AK171]